MMINALLLLEPVNGQMKTHVTMETMPEESVQDQTTDAAVFVKVLLILSCSLKAFMFSFHTCTCVASTDRLPSLFCSILAYSKLSYERFELFVTELKFLDRN